MASYARQLTMESDGSLGTQEDYESSDSDSSPVEEILTASERLARLRERRGLCEIEISETGEAGSIEKNMADCKKNPGHHNFHHVQRFTKNHLPRDYQDRELCRAIKTCAELTVNIFHTSISSCRPKFFPNSSSEFALHGIKETEMEGIFKGTGWVWSVEKCGEGSHQKTGPCECLDCKYLDTADKKRTWWDIIIMTAAHVVYDEQECQTTTVLLFDEEFSNRKKEKLKARVMGDSNVEGDRGIFTCASHDAELCKFLKTRCIRRAELINKCDDKFRRDNLKGLTVVVSHPHGDKKRVSLGEGIDRVDEEIASHFEYNTPTCFGSSGGFVWAVGWGSIHGSVAPHSRGVKKTEEGAMKKNSLTLGQSPGQENKSGWSWPL